MQIMFNDLCVDPLGFYLEAAKHKIRIYDDRNEFATDKTRY